MTHYLRSAIQSLSPGSTGQKWGLRKPGSLGLLAVALLTTACGDPLKFGQDLEEARILAVQVRTASGHAWPGENEDAELAILVAGPDGPAEVQTGLQLCEASSSSWGTPHCAAEPFAETELSPSKSPLFSFEGNEISEEQRLAVLGVACGSGKPELSGDPEEWSCDDSSDALRFSFETDGRAVENLVPELEGTEISLDEQTVTFVPPDRKPDCSDALSVAADKKMQLMIQLDEASREEGETLQISHFSTAGRVERQFSILDPDESLAVELEFKTPEEVGPVRSYLVVRDGRGGTSWLSWDVCVED